MLGPAPILDFDGTIAVLPVDWLALRRRLGVATIAELWEGDGRRWEVVTRAEVSAATRADAVPATIRALGAVTAFGVLTNNSEAAVREFFLRFETLAGKLAAVVGRESLAGPKHDPDRFRAGFERCAEATAGPRGKAPVVYVGDAAYELALAAGLGATALDVLDIDG